MEASSLRSRRQKVELLRRSELFSGLSGRALGGIADVASEVRFGAGRPIVRQGDAGTGFYVIVTGRAHVVRDGVTVATFGPGDFFGELAVLDREPRVASVVADEPTVCLALAAWDFERLLIAQPRVTLRVLREMARRLRAANVEHRTW